MKDIVKWNYESPVLKRKLHFCLILTPASLPPLYAQLNGRKNLKNDMKPKALGYLSSWCINGLLFCLPVFFNKLKSWQSHTSSANKRSGHATQIERLLDVHLMLWTLYHLFRRSHSPMFFKIGVFR